MNSNFKTFTGFDNNRNSSCLMEKKNYERCSFRLHDMLENMKIVITRPGLPNDVWSLRRNLIIWPKLVAFLIAFQFLVKS